MTESTTHHNQAATYRVAFIGLGVMGYPMAGHLMKRGHDVAVFNRSDDKAERWVEAFGGSSFATPKLAAAGCDFVCVCVGNDEDVRQVVLGADGALAGMESGSVLIDHTTASAELARELGQLASEQTRSHPSPCAPPPHPSRRAHACLGWRMTCRRAPHHHRTRG